MTAKTEPCECDERACPGVRVVPTPAPYYQPQLFAGSDVEVLDPDSWCTPEGGPGVFGLVHVRSFFGGRVDLDPCSNRQSTVGARVCYTLADDGLSKPWVLTPGAVNTVYVNNPYSKPRPWMKRCSDAFAKGAEVLALPKGDWSTSWWQDYVRTAPARCELSKRMAFVSKGKRSVANFPSVLVYWGRRVDEFAAHFEAFGEIVRGPAAPGWTP